MPISRREFLTAGGVLAAATLVPGRLVAALEQAAAPPRPVDRWSDVRALFRLDKDYLHFSSFFIASHPEPVRTAIDDFRRVLDANPFLTVEHALFESEAANLQLKVRADAAAYLGGTVEEVAITHNTTTALALVYHGLPLKAGDEVLTTTHDHFVHHESIRLATARVGATSRRITLFDDPAKATVGGIVGRLREAIRAETRVVGVTWVHSSTGMRLPIREIAAAVRDANRGRDERDRVLLVVDGVHGLGAVEGPIADLGCDYFCAGTHKWIFGPRGTGMIWARAGSWSRLRPVVPDFSNLANFEAWMNGTPPPPTNAANMSPGGFVAFEHQWALGAAFRLHQRLGRERVAARIRELNDRCKQGLASIPRVRVHTPKDPALSAGLIAFEVDGVTPTEVVARLLEKKIVASTSPYKVSYARLAPSLVNDEQEVDTVVRALRTVAGA